MSEEYKVGYRHPPQASQFKKGKSGNPGGRPKNTKNLKTDLSEELADEIQIIQGGRNVTMSKQRAIVVALVTKAIDGRCARNQYNIQNDDPIIGRRPDCRKGRSTFFGRSGNTRGLSPAAWEVTGKRR